MSSAPEQIYVWPFVTEDRTDGEKAWAGGHWGRGKATMPATTVYIHKAHSDALIAAAYQVAADKLFSVLHKHADYDQVACCDGQGCGCRGVMVFEEIGFYATADLTPADARAAYDAAIAEAKRQGMREALSIAIDHTPEKFSAAVASHVTGKAIQDAIREALDAGPAK